eukprot:scaffold238122_cov17-Prasinocladus_malaysianus.AAC.1
MSLIQSYVMHCDAKLHMCMFGFRRLTPVPTTMLSLPGLQSSAFSAMGLTLDPAAYGGVIRTGLAT